MLLWCNSVRRKLITWLAGGNSGRKEREYRVKEARRENEMINDVEGSGWMGNKEGVEQEVDGGKK